MFGVHISTVFGKLRITGFSFVEPSASITLSQIYTAFSTSVPLKLSGEYSNLKFVSPVYSSVSCLISFAPSIAIFVTPSISVLNTTFLCKVDVEL